MTDAEAILFYGAHIKVPLDCLWWQDGGMGLRPLSEAPHVEAARQVLAGGDLTGTSYADVHGRSWGTLSVEGRPDAFAELTRSIAAGWRKGVRAKVGISHRGRIVLTDGLHRCSAALAAGHSTVPVEIVYRASEWWAFKHALLAVAGKPHLYQPIDHPDLAWPSWRTDTHARAATILEAVRKLAPGAVRALDFGCHVGVLSCALARGGYHVLGSDTDERAVTAATMLAGMDDIGARGLARFGRCKALSEALPHVGFAVCLSLLNHHASDGRDAEGHAIFRALVEAASVVFLDCPHADDPPETGGGSAIANPAGMLAWLAAARAPGTGRVLVERGTDLQRTLLVWTR